MLEFILGHPKFVENTLWLLDHLKGEIADTLLASFNTVLARQNPKTLLPFLPLILRIVDCVGINPTPAIKAIYLLLRSTDTLQHGSWEVNASNSIVRLFDCSLSRFVEW